MELEESYTVYDYFRPNKMEDPPNQEDTGGATTPTPTVNCSEDTVATASNHQQELFNKHPNPQDTGNLLRSIDNKIVRR